VQYHPNIESQVSGKRVPLRGTTVQKMSTCGLSLEGECTNVVEGTHS